MKKIIVSLFLGLILVGCDGVGTILDDGDLFEQYRNSYVGDNTEVGNLANNLMASRSLKQFSLYTEEEPYGIILEYRNLEEEEKKETIITNATFLFALIKNVDEITFQFSNEAYTINRERFELWLREDLNAIETQKELENIIEEKLQSEYAVTQFFRLFCCSEQQTIN